MVVATTDDGAPGALATNGTGLHHHLGAWALVEPAAVIPGSTLMSKRMPFALALLFCLGTLGETSLAQGIPFSQHGDVAQRVAFTDIAIAYNRPTARGRVIWGDSGLVKFDAIWHPGADSASHITFSRPVTVEGQAVPAGTYSLWIIPRRVDAWTVILNARGRVFHTPYPGTATDVLRVDVRPLRAAQMESMAYYFPVVARDSAVLHLHWGETVVPMRIRVSTEP